MTTADEQWITTPAGEPAITHTELARLYSDARHYLDSISIAEDLIRASSAANRPLPEIDDTLRDLRDIRAAVRGVSGVLAALQAVTSAALPQPGGIGWLGHRDARRGE